MGALEYFTTVVSYDLTVSKIGSGFVTPTVGVHSYNDGTVVSLTAAPATGWVFDKWSGDVTSTNASETITINANKSVTAEFKQIQHTLTVNTVGNGTVTRSVQPVNGTYTYGTGVTLTAVPAAGYQFDGWSGASTQLTLSTVVIMDADKTVTANFSLIQYELSIFATNGTATPNSGTLVNGVYTYNPGTIVEILAVPNSGYIFDHYEVSDSNGTTNSSTNPLSITMSDHISVEVYFTATYDLIANVVGSGSVSPSGTTTHNDGTVVSVTATPATGWSFDGWSGASTSVNPNISITMDADKTVTANFSQIQYELTIIENDGTVTPNSGTLANGVYTYNYGTVVEITAVANTGFVFDHYEVTDSNGTANSSANPLSITMSENMTVEAFYTATYELTTTVTGSGSVSPSGTTTHNDGATVSITATPAAGWVFSNWSGDASGSANPLSVTMNADKTIEAVFTQIQRTLTTTVTGSGSVSPSGTTTHNDGATVSITATPAAGWVFSNWSGDASGTINPLSVTMNADKTIEAVFTQIQYELTIIDNNNNGVSTPDSGTLANGVYTYNDGTVVEITAVANTGFVFHHYDVTDSNGTTTSVTNPLTITMTENMVVEAFYNSTAGVNDNIALEFNIYPNPVNNVLNIQINEEISNVEIFSLLGQKVIENKSKQINVSNLENGIYIIKVSSEGKIATKRFIKK